MGPNPNLWFLAVGALLVAMALAGSVLKRLPLSGSMLYLAAGYSLGPAALGLMTADPVRNSAVLERVTEVAVIISLFTAGLKLRTPLNASRWGLPIRLATVSMLATVGLVAAAGYWGLGLPLGAAVLLGGVLAPTDPVLAADVQVADPSDRDKLRFALTGEAGMNDGTAFPFVMLGLGLLGVHELGANGWRWWLVDALWAIPGGLLIGAVLGTLVGRLVLYLRKHYHEAVGLDEFLALGLIGLSYGTAVLAHAYGFLAVFAAGLALRRMEMRSGAEPPEEVKVQARAGAAEEVATDPQTAPAYMAEAVLASNERIERVCEVAVVVILGGLLASVTLRAEMLWFVPMLLLVFRPLSVVVSVLGARVWTLQTVLMGWFGIRGIGSLYYLMFALEHQLDKQVGRLIADVALVTVAVSIVVHGVSVTPLMDLYLRRKQQRQRTEPLEPTAATRA
ncbi:MAG TPA: sodium:proton antiporter [Fimbriiglobus sp.]|jgi:NhaP-type Na+/H+ or K+/H+ antiporter|nr:sodium:proton antiporter [Fimbriiglobus sp.]